jgi:hypothetical protein
MSKDLIAVVADLDMEQTLKGLLSRPQRLGIRAIDYDLLRHPERDNGCWNGADLFLQSQASSYAHALVLFDHQGSGQEKRSVNELQSELETRLAGKGWTTDRAKVVIIQPELEIWVWSDSPQVDQVLGWQGRQPDLRTWLAGENLIISGDHKPNDPKAAMRRALHKVKKQPSASLFRELAENVSLQRCTDAGFQRLTAILQAWFAHR